jgi:type IV secretion system protein VirD4
VLPIALVIDEMPALGHLKQLLAASATARGSGVLLYPIVVQSLTQLRAIYGEDDLGTFVSTSDCIASYAPRDVFTAEYLSKLCGEKVVTATNHTASANGDGSASVGWSKSPQFQKVFRPDELMAMPPGRLLVLIAGLPPFFTQVENYWENKRLARHLDPNPYYHSL